MPTHVYRQRVETGPAGRHITEERIEENTPAEYNPAGRYAAFRVLYYLLDVVEVILAARLLLRLLAANPGNAFVSFIYQISWPFVAAFRGALPSTVSQGTVIEWSTVLAMIVYALVVYIIVRLIDLAARP